MPTPIGHSLAAIALHLATRKPTPRRTWAWAVGFMVLANLPDVDFLIGYLAGDPRAYHWRATHSLAAVVLVAAAVGWLARRQTGGWARASALAAAAYGSHLALDMLMGRGSDLSIGLQLFWPVSTDRFMAPWSLFRMAPHSIEALGPVRVFFSREILPMVLREVLVLVPILLAALLLRTSRESAAETSLPELSEADA